MIFSYIFVTYLVQKIGIHEAIISIFFLNIFSENLRNIFTKFIFMYNQYKNFFKKIFKKSFANKPTRLSLRRQCFILTNALAYYIVAKIAAVKCFIGPGPIIGRHDTQHNDVQHNDTPHNHIQHNDIQHKINKMQHSAKWYLA